MKGQTAEHWYSLPATDRVLNYDVHEVRKCLSAMMTTYSDQMNSSQYCIELNQNDSSFIQELPTFEGRLDSNTSEFTSESVKKAELFKLFNNALGQVNLNDDLMFKLSKMKIIELGQSLRSITEEVLDTSNNSDDEVTNDGLTRFPNARSGRCTVDKITARNR